MASDVFSPYLISSMIGSVSWTVQNADQKKFLSTYRRIDQRERERVPECTVHVSHDNRELNEILRANGFSTDFPPLGNNEHGVIGIMDIAFNWQARGERGRIYAVPGNEYIGVHMHSDRENHFRIDYAEAGNYPYPIAVVVLNDGISRACFTQAIQECHGMQMLDIVTSLHGRVPEYGYEGLSFPVSALDKKASLDWLIGLSNSQNVITYAACSYKLTADEMGVVVKMAGEVVITSWGAVALPRRFVLARPFFLWMERDGCSLPIFVAYLDQEAWTVDQDWLREVEERKSKPQQSQADMNREAFFRGEFR